MGRRTSWPPFRTQDDKPVAFLTLAHLEARVVGAAATWMRCPRVLPAGVARIEVPASAGLMTLPVPPEGAPYRVLACEAGKTWRVVQHCVDAGHEAYSVA